MEPVSTRAAVQILRVLPRERITRLVGRVTQAHVPPRLLRPVLSLYGRAFRVDWDEAVVPEAGFTSFNDFFTRRLRDGIHHVDLDPASVVSPADGRLEDEGPIDAGRTFHIKGQAYDAATLLGSHEDAARYAGGRYFIVYLSPRDYHRVHSPVEGRVSLARHLPGTLFPVNALGVTHVPQLFARNERVFVQVESPFGPVAVVLVGAFVVGKISLAFDGPPRPPHGGAACTHSYPPETAPQLQRGAELGAFLLGSTVVVLLPPAPPDGPPHAWHPVYPAEPRPVRMGEALVRRGPA